MNFKLKRMMTFMVVFMCGVISVIAQNLTAAQMNIYFGQPKKATVTNSQGTVVTEFDPQGRIISISQGNMRAVYDWEEDGSEVTMTMFQGQNIKDSGIIKIAELSKKHYSYEIGGMVNVTVDFKENCAMSGSSMASPQMVMTTKYYYNNADDMFPYAIEQSMGNQSLKASLSIDRIDSVGNPIEFTEEMMGQKSQTRQTIEYY